MMHLYHVRIDNTNKKGVLTKLPMDNVLKELQPIVTKKCKMQLSASVVHACRFFFFAT